MNIVFVLGSSLILMVFVTTIVLYHKKALTLASADPLDINYRRKTDKELYIFLLQSCIATFFISVISYQIFIYIALLYWIYFVLYMILFSKIWKFHGKKPLILFAILILTAIVAFIAAPLVRNGISKIIILYFKLAT